MTTAWLPPSQASSRRTRTSNFPQREMSAHCWYPSRLMASTQASSAGNTCFTTAFFCRCGAAATAELSKPHPRGDQGKVPLAAACRGGRPYRGSHAERVRGVWNEERWVVA
jgi:hypothetical protein